MTETAPSPSNSLMKRLIPIGLLACLSLLGASSASAQQPQIGVQFLGRASTTAPANPGLLQQDIAGAVPQQNWNLIDDAFDPSFTTPFNGTTSVLSDSNIVSTAGVTLTFAASDSWNDNVASTSITTPNAILLNGTIKSTIAQPTESFQFNNVPEGQYDLYVYTTVDGAGWEAAVADGDNITTYYIKEWEQFYDTNTLVRATNTNPNGTFDTGSYVKLSNLGTYGRGTIGATVTKIGNVSGQNGTGVAGLELVPAGAAQVNTTPLSFLVQPISRRGADGTNDVTFTSLERGPAFYRQWLMNGTAIAGETNSTYTPNPISIATMQGAKISITASNNLNSITSSNATLTVGQLITVNGAQVLNGGAVTITQQPQPATEVAVRSGPATFSVAATSSFIGDASGAAPPINYQWESAPKGSTTFTPITSATNTSYRTPVLQLTDDGTQFRAVVTASDANVNSSVALLTVLPNTNPPVATAGAIINNAGVVEVGVSFDEQVDPATVVQGNFALSSGTITGFKLATNSYLTYAAAILETTGLTPGTAYTLTAHGVTDLSGNVLPSTNLSFTVPAGVQWAEIGSPPAPGQVIPVGKDGFDILNGGRQEWNSYDEVDMAYVKKTNDFDVKVQVIYIEPASEWTRCGLVARNWLDIGNKSDAGGTDINSTNHLCSAYAQTHVNGTLDLKDTGIWPASDPVQIANGASNNNHEQNERLAAGSATTAWLTGTSGGPPDFPNNVWLRLARVGTVITGYSSTDGVIWNNQGTTTLTDQTNVMYVGTSLSVETGNIWGGNWNVFTSPFDPQYDRLFVAQFRGFGDYTAAVQAPTIIISKAGSALTITFTGSTLQQSPKVGPGATWSPVTGATSPYPVPTSSSAMFFRALQ
jgi:hypothetical protein